MQVQIKRLVSTFRLSCIVLGIMAIPGRTLLAQDAPVFDKASLRDSVTALLSRYQLMHNQLNSRSDSQVESEFMHLFSNSKVQVPDQPIDKTKVVRISIEEYLGKIGELFPDGLAVNLTLSGLYLEQPKYERNNRYTMRARVHTNATGITGGKVYGADGKIIYQIAFYYTNNQPVNFTIYGIELPPEGEGFLSATGSWSAGIFTNPTLASDSRMGTQWASGYRGSLGYTWYQTRNWGFGAGIQYAMYAGTLTLDRFDDLGGFDPHMTNVKISNALWQVELPLYVAWRSNPDKKIEVRADIGVVPGVRVFETMSSTAINENTGTLLHNVISDPDWIGLMNRANLAVQGNLALVYHLNRNVGFLLGCGIHQGVTGLDSNVKVDFSADRYLGQYNPLWGVPGTTVNQSVYLNLGMIMRIKGDKKK